MDESTARTLAEIAAGREWDRALVRSLRTMRVSRRRRLCELVVRPAALLVLLAASATVLATALVTGAVTWTAAFAAAWVVTCTLGFAFLCSLIPDAATRPTTEAHHARRLGNGRSGNP